MMGAARTTRHEDLDVPDTTFTGPDPTTFLGLDALGQDRGGTVPGAGAGGGAVPHARRLRGPLLPVLRGPGAGSWDGGPAPGARAGGVAAHQAAGTRAALRLHFLPAGAGGQDTSTLTLAEPRAPLTRAAVDWGLRAPGLESMSISRAATALGVTWHTANSAILARAEQTIVNDPDRFEGARGRGR